MQEIHRCLKLKSVSHGIINRSNKPYWNIELSQLWRNAKQKERNYIKHKDTDRVILRAQFVFAQRSFDKELRGAKDML